MRTTLSTILLVCTILVVAMPALGGTPQVPLSPGRTLKKPAVPKAVKDATSVLKAFRVTRVEFKTISVNNQNHLAVGVVFNKNIDAVTVKQNQNIRLLKRTPSNFWVDASTQNNTVRIRPNVLTWVCGAALEEHGAYKMRLRGTIKSSDGQYLDCNGDGKGEGFNLPAYESQTYQAPGSLIEQLVN